MRKKKKHIISVWFFPTKLGWMAIAGHKKKVNWLSFGYETRKESTEMWNVSKYNTDLVASSRCHNWNPELAEQLTAYASGVPVSFESVKTDSDVDGESFSGQVLQRCQKIPYGDCLTYQQLAEKVKRPRAARAVGNVMSRNRVPIIIPCHRVIAAHGGLGGFSMPKGVEMKRKLLGIESASIKHTQYIR